MSDELSSDLASLRIDRRAERAPRRWPRYALAAGVLVAIATSVGLGLPYLEARIFKTAVEVSEVALVSPAQAQIDLTATGYVVPQVMSRITPKIEGRIAEVLVREGDVVERGQLLVKLDDADRHSAIAAARARVAAARARAHAERANLAEAQLKARRQRLLANRGTAPVADAEDLEARVAAIRAAVTAAEAEVTAAQAQVGALQVDLDYMRIVAPIAGTVVSKPAEVGESVGDITPILELADLGSIQVEVDVPEARLDQVRRKGPCEIVLDAYPRRRYRGEVASISPRLNRAKATATVKVAFADEAQDVRPEMAARVSFLREALDQAALEQPPKVVVPASAVIERGGSKVVFVVDDGRVRLRPVKLKGPFAGGHEVEAGLEAGQQVVADPPPTLADGQRIKEKTKP